MAVLTEHIEKNPPWAMMFADDLVMCGMIRDEVDEDLETWRVVFERYGLKISRTKTEYLPSRTNETETTVTIVDARWLRCNMSGGSDSTPDSTIR